MPSMEPESWMQWLKRWRQRAKAAGHVRTLGTTADADVSSAQLHVRLTLTPSVDLIEVTDDLGSVHAVQSLPPVHNHITPYRTPEVKEQLVKFLKKVEPTSATSAGGRNLGKSKLLDTYPALAEYMTTEKWDDTTPRMTASITIVLTESGWKASVNDRDAERSSFSTGPTPELAMAALEARLAADECDWRPWSEGFKRKETKKRRN